MNTFYMIQVIEWYYIRPHKNQTNLCFLDTQKQATFYWARNVITTSREEEITNAGKKFLLEYELYCNSITLKTSLISLKNMTVHIHPQCCHFSFWYARFSVQKQHKWILGVGDIILYNLWKNIVPMVNFVSMVKQRGNLASETS